MENVNHSSSSSSADDHDHHQNPPILHPPAASRSKAGGWKAIKYILGNESFEKLASMSLIANITVYLNKNYNLSGIFLVNVINIWNGFSNISSLAGAFVSDTYLGKFRTLLLGSISSLLGMGTLTLTAGIHQLRPSSVCTDKSHCPQPKSWQLCFLFTGLGLLSLGAGGIRPCNIAFGADQFDTKTEKGRAQLESFFNWWYFTFTVALVIALTAVVYIQTDVSWTLGFAIPTACFVLSITIFLIGRHTYVYVKPQGSIFSDMVKVITAACRKYGASTETGSEKPFYNPNMATRSNTDAVKLPHTDRFKFLDKAAIIIDPNELDIQGMPKNGWRLCSLQQVEQLKCLVAIMPVWVTAIGTFLTMDQQNTFGVLQALQMDRSIGKHFDFPPGWMNITSMLTLSVWIYIYERVYIPQMKKMTGEGKRLSTKVRILIGIVMSILCMLVAGIVEEHRRNLALKHGSFISPASFALLLPQFCLSGLNEAFAAVAIMEFFTMQLPDSMRTVAGAIFFLSLSISSYLGTFIVNIIHKVTSNKSDQLPWLGGHDLNKIRLDYYYYFIAALGALNFAYFNFYASRYVLRSNFSGSEGEEVVLERSVACNSSNNMSDECNITIDKEKGLERHIGSNV
ncbi:hypothetical protein FEM48_Zijuj05G0156300 [Ziziphus jujuba var. spinosa]|uniref:Protein NRT1/ PTR FAMILY 2.8-like n=1 Tax=Ziziphus jujuba var. spinosa TaxID=714518 RepID=A0A978VFN3_ZIZJJ|nr:hypothetical protein FEM48_Zijuj05G0156300 [Ziziphus jujuba var. spinosa]